jgi:hypothetical protein
LLLLIDSFHYCGTLFRSEALEAPDILLRRGLRNNRRRYTSQQTGGSQPLDSFHHRLTPDNRCFVTSI